MAHNESYPFRDKSYIFKRTIKEKIRVQSPVCDNLLAKMYTFGLNSNNKLCRRFHGRHAKFNKVLFATKEELNLP